jgi:hypothetical protein
METLIQEVSAALRRYCQPQAVMLVGTAVEQNRNPSDLDFLILLGDQYLDVTTIKQLSLILGAEKCMVCDDAYRLLIKDKPDVSLAFMPMAQVKTEIFNFISGRWVTGERRFWAIGCRLPEAFVGDVVFGRVLYDRSDELSRIRATLSVYPENARKALLGYCGKEIVLKLDALDRSSHDPMIQVVLRGDLVISLIRVACASERKYLRGLKRTSELGHLLGNDGREFFRAANLIASGEGLEAVRDICSSFLANYKE